MNCTKCFGRNCVKAGFNHGAQRYKCKDCGRQFTKTIDKNSVKRAFALYLYAVGLSMNAIAKLLAVEPSTVLYWVKNFALKVYEKPEKQEYSDDELDEMRNLLESKKINFGSKRHIAAMPINWSAGKTEA